MRVFIRAILPLIALVLASEHGTAQTITGAIRGHVGDAQGLALPGVGITATSTSLQGSRSTTSSENGDYLLPVLPPGIYQLRFELGGFRTLDQRVTLTAMQVLPVDVTLGLAAQQELVTVVGRSADVQTGTPQVAVTFSQDLMTALPTTRDLNASLLLAPGVHPTGPNGAYSFAGAPSFESLYMVNGVSVTENLRGQPLNLYIEDAIQETVIAVGGISAEYGRFSGGLANVITKSGGNIFSGSLRDTYNNDRWRTLTPFEKTQLAANPALGDTRTNQAVPAYEYTFGGPAVKDRLWFFTAGRMQTQASTRTLNRTNIPFTYKDRTRRYEGKGTYALAAGHRFQVNFLKIQQAEENFTFNIATTPPAMDLRSLGTRQSPQNLYSVSYHGLLTPSLSVEARYSARNLSYIGAGAKTRDPIEGTLLIDLPTGGRYWSDTLCGVCEPEQRDNQDVYLKGSYFLSTPGTGTHAVVFGYDNFNDFRQADNHQSGSDYRVIVNDTYKNVNGEIYPKILGADSTTPDTAFVQTSFIPASSLGANFRTHSLFFNDSWQVNSRLTANLGLRWDKNHGVDQAGALVARDGAFSPRLGLVWDPIGDGRWTLSGGFAKYVSAISNIIADSSAPAGNAQSFLYYYRGPSINVDGPELSTTQALERVFAWFNQAEKTGALTFAGTPNIPGLTPQIGSDLSSPYAYEYSSGLSRQFRHGTVRFDGSYRDYKNAYASVIDRSTGTVKNQYTELDLAVIQNTDILKRRYAGLTSFGTYRVGAVTQVGGQYTLSRTWGNFDGENATGGPIPSQATQYPEYKQEAWSFPTGDLAVDQRHRARLWINYGVPGMRGLTVSAIETLESGVPYGAWSAAGVSPGVVAGAPAYKTPPVGSNTVYYYTARDAFRTEGQRRTDLGINYNYDIDGVRGVGRLQLFAQAHVINLFNQFQLCACGQSVFLNGGAVTPTNIDTTIVTPVGSGGRFATFNPFTTQPVRGTNWDFAPSFGTARNRFAYTTPRQFRMSFGVRF